MRIDELFIRNFRGFEYKDIAFSRQFTLVVGENGSGKSTILNAAAVALGIFGITRLSRKWRKIESHEIRETVSEQGERTMAARSKVTSVNARGQIGSAPRVFWERVCKGRSRPAPTVNFPTNEALKALKQLVVDAEAHRQPLPVLAHYGAGRNWRPSAEKILPALPETKEQREDGYRDCLDEEVRTADLLQWFVREAAARDSRGRFRQSYEVVVEALRACIPGVENVGYDPRIQQPVITIGGHSARFTNLSDGQRAMAAVVADIAIRAITLNSYLIPERKRGRKADPLRVLRETPGVVLIDELDVHLHPKWQRTVVESLRGTFPAMQFICTTHSPFIIQSARPGEVISLDGSIEVEDYVGASIEDITENVQGVEVPQQSERAAELARATERYFSLIQKNGKVSPQALADAEREYRKISGIYSMEPGLNAILELRAMAAAEAAKKKRP